VDSPRTAPTSSVSVEVLVEEYKILPVGVRGVALIITMAGPLAIWPREKDGSNTIADLLANLQKVLHVARACGTLHLQLVTIEVIVPFQALDDQEVD